jgi:hypothetical protein
MTSISMADFPTIRGVAMSLGRLIEWDGKIPVWGLLLLGIGQVAWGYNALNDLDKRVSLHDASVTQIRLELSRVALQQQQLAAVEGGLNTVKELLVRIERRLDRAQ